MAKLTTQPPEWIHTAPTQISATREMSATADEVFAALADHESWPEWFGAIKRVERFGDLKEGLGSNRRVFINKRVAIDEEFNVWEPGKRWGFVVLESTVGGLKSMSELVTIEDAENDRVSVTYKMGIAPNAVLAPILRIARGGMKKNLEKALAGLEKHLTTT